MHEKKVQSPSSIKTFKQCPRKYYYQYILKLETFPNIHTLRGNIAHSVLEHFFDIDTSLIDLNNCEAHLKMIVQKLLLKEWQNAKDELDKLKLPQEKHMHYFEETLMMLFNWTDLFLTKIHAKKGTFAERFTALTPMRELLFTSETYHAKGFIDAIEKNDDGTVRIMDYKTSSSQNLDDHILQLAIYSLLYFDKHGQLPKQAGIYFLKGRETTLDVDHALLEMAKKEIQHVHDNTATTDINHYQKIVTPLCKWSTGKCDFYDTCRPHD